MWFLLALLPAFSSFYLPGVAPHDYSEGDKIELFVNSLSAVDSLLPYDFYYPRFHFCKPKEIKAQTESLGAILFGDRLYNSPFELNALVEKKCEALCTVTIPAEDATFINHRIREMYTMNWVVDGLPAAQEVSDREGEEYYSPGFDLGQMISPEGKTDAGDPFLNNHYEMVLQYHTTKTNRIRVVGVIVRAFSLSAEQQSKCSFDGIFPNFALSDNAESKVSYTYSVKWEEAAISWGTRWDHYLHVFDPNVHWFSIINSIVIVLILGAMVTLILLRALHKDIARYNSLLDEENGQDEFGWKLVHADVFRPPMYRMLLSTLIGNGVQIFSMLSVTILFAALGLLSPSVRGGLGTIMLATYILFSSLSGYVSARLYKSLEGKHWKTSIALTAYLIPGMCFTILLILNFFLIANQSSAAVPFGALLSLVAVWFLISSPLSAAGAYFGFRHPAFEAPSKTNQIPRQIPAQSIFLNKWNAAIMGGILPFGAIFIELYFILSSFWSHRIYYMFGFLFVVFLILILTCSLVSVLLCYFHLCAEDYLWSWRAFTTTATSGLYVFLYSMFFFSKKLHLTNTSSGFLFFGWSLVISVLFGIFTGSVGYISAALFVRKIFGSIKVD